MQIAKTAQIIGPVVIGEGSKVLDYAVIRGPVAEKSVPGVIWGAVIFAIIALSTQVVMHYRQRLALELGEGVADGVCACVARVSCRVSGRVAAPGRFSRLPVALCQEQDILPLYVRGGGGWCWWCTLVGPLEKV